MKKTIVYIMIGIIIISMTGCINVSKKGKIDYIGFNATFKQDKSSNINNYNKIREKMIELEAKIAREDIRIKQIDFSETSNSLYFTFTLNEQNEKIYYNYLRKNDQEEFKFYNCKTAIYNEKTLKKVKNVLIDDMDFSEEEVKEVQEVVNKGDYKRFRTYLVDFEEENDSYGTKKIFRIIDEA